MKRNRIILICVFLILFIVNTILMFTDNVSSFDDIIYNYLLSFRKGWLDTIFIIITMSANTVSIIVITAFLVLLLKRRERFMLLTTIIGTVVVNQILKHFICRARPNHLRLIQENGYSYPSGHAMIAIALYGFLIYYIYQKVMNKYLKIFLISILLLFIIAIGCSRIYVGVHYPSDVLGGYLLSLSILMIVISYFNDYYRGDLNDKNGSK